jgi:hypothetical protein
MWLYDLPERAHVPQWINLAKPYVVTKPDRPLAARVAVALRHMRANWEAYDARYDREVDYDGSECGDTESDWDEWEEDSDEYAEDPDEEWYYRKNSLLG